MVTSPTGKGVIVIGGSTEPFEFSKAMFELFRSLDWTRLEQTLKIEHLLLQIQKKVESEEKCSSPENRHSVKQHLCSKKIVKFLNKKQTRKETM